MVLLIDKTKVAEILQVAIGYDSKEFEVFINEAQEFDLKPLVCEEFYYELLKKYEDGSVWQKLLEGGDYTYNTNELQFRGVADVIAYFAHARFILKSNVVSTTHGFTIKKTPHSEPLGLDERRNFYYSYRKDANTLFEDVKKFIERNKTDYPSWNCGSDCESTPRGSFKTRVIQ